jgi:hypothetical protein
VDLEAFAHGDSATAAAGAEIGGAIARAQLQRLKTPASRTLRASLDDLLLADRDPRTRDPFAAVYAAGVTLAPDGPRPAVFVSDRLAPEAAREGASAPLAELRVVQEVLVKGLAAHEHLPGVRRGLETLLDGEGTKRTVVVGLPAPRPQYGPGRRVDAFGAHGTLGALARTAGGDDAILTAGHLALAGTVVTNTGGDPADVVFSIDPAQVPAGVLCADVAVVVPRSPSAWTPGVATTAPAQARAGDSLTMTGGVSGTQTATIVGAAREFLVPGSSGLWADVFMTDHGISAGGDSGAPATLDGETGLLGHLVGASGQITSFVQEIDVQLAAAGVGLR